MEGFNFAKLWLLLAELCSIALVVMILVLGTKQSLTYVEVVLGTLFTIFAVAIDRMHVSIGWRK